MCACHIDPTAGHMGKSRTLYKIKEKYIWHELLKDVVEKVSLFKIMACPNVSTDCKLWHLPMNQQKIDNRCFRVNFGSSHQSMASYRN